MKKVLLIFVFAVVSSTTFAQFNQGRILAGGSLSFSSETDKSKVGGTTVTNGKTTAFEFLPQAGYFVIDNLAVGAGLGLSTSKFKPENDNASENTLTSVYLNPFVRYYLNQGVFFQGDFLVGSSNSKSKNGNVTVERKFGLSGFGISAGYAYFLNDNVAIEPQIGYRSFTSTDKDSDPEEKEISAGLFLRVGLQVYLGSK